MARRLGLTLVTLSSLAYRNNEISPIVGSTLNNFGKSCMKRGSITHHGWSLMPEYVVRLRDKPSPVVAR